MKIAYGFDPVIPAKFIFMSINEVVIVFVKDVENLLQFVIRDTVCGPMVIFEQSTADPLEFSQCQFMVTVSAKEIMLNKINLKVYIDDCLHYCE